MLDVWCCSQCHVANFKGGQELAVGLSKNHFLVHLDLSGNAFAADGMKAPPKVPDSHWALEPKKDCS